MAKFTLNWSHWSRPCFGIFVSTAVDKITDNGWQINPEHEFLTRQLDTIKKRRRRRRWRRRRHRRRQRRRRRRRRRRRQQIGEWIGAFTQLRLLSLKACNRSMRNLPHLIKSLLDIFSSRQLFLFIQLLCWKVGAIVWTPSNVAEGHPLTWRPTYKQDPA